jgi:hypothetical protein
VFFFVSTPLRVSTTSRQQEKKNPSLKTLKPLSIHTQNRKVRNLLQYVNWKLMLSVAMAEQG